MRLRRNTPAQLVFSHRPWFMGLIGGFFLLAGLGNLIAVLTQGLWDGLIASLGASVLGFGVLYYFARPARIVLDRPSNSVEIIQTTLTGTRRVTHALDEVSQARVGSNRSGTLQQGRRNVWLEIVIPKGQSAGKHRVFSPFAGGGNCAYAAKTINAWLAKP